MNCVNGHIGWNGVDEKVSQKLPSRELLPTTSSFWQSFNFCQLEPEKSTFSGCSTIHLKIGNGHSLLICS